MISKKYEEHIAKREAQKQYDMEHPQPNPSARIPRNEDPVEFYHSMVHDVTSWPLDAKKDVDGAFRYFEKKWVPAAARHLSAGNYSDVVYMSSAFFSQFPEFVERSECQEMLSALARDKKVRRLVRGMMHIGREALHAADNSYLNEVAHSFMRNVRNQPFYREYRVYSMIEDEK